MASLSDLPDDIVYEIVSHIQERKMLREISLLSRKFKIPSSVFLYRRVCGGPHTLYHFERTISERPELAKYVKQVCLRFEPDVVGLAMAIQKILSGPIWAQSNKLLNVWAFTTSTPWLTTYFPY
jgi:hypothetical protein